MGPSAVFLGVYCYLFNVNVLSINHFSATSFVPSINLKPSTVTPAESVMGGKKMMPDITNNTLQKNVSSDKLKGILNGI